jgi:hypothetical protein
MVQAHPLQTGVCAFNGHCWRKKPLTNLYQLDVKLHDLRPIAAIDFVGSAKNNTF